MAKTLIPLENILAIECPLEIGRRDYHSSSNLFAHDQLHDDEGDYWKWVISQSEMGGPAVSLASLELRRFLCLTAFCPLGGWADHIQNFYANPPVDKSCGQSRMARSCLTPLVTSSLFGRHTLPAFTEDNTHKKTQLLQKRTQTLPHIKNTAFTESTLCHTAFAHGML